MGNRAAEARCLCYLGRNQIQSDYALESLHYLRAAHVTSRQLKLGREDRAAIFLAVALLDLGEYDEALKLAHEHTAKRGPIPIRSNTCKTC